jgi:chemotaxis protein methyltransferase CheR
MIIDEFFGQEKPLWDTRLLATDISDKVLNTAIKGVYNKEQVSPLPPRWLKLYFHKDGKENYRINDSIRSEVIFRKFNLMNWQYPFKKKFHVIFCRNVMIYFDNRARYDLVNRFYEYTEPGGYLFVGHSESLNREQTKYKYIMPAIYRKLV